MISKFRKSANNIFVRFFLVLISLSFLGFGASIYMKGNSTGNIVNFSKVDSITVEEFDEAKNKLVREIQQNSGIELTPENLDNLNINYLVLRQLVNKSMISYLADIYEFDVSEKKIITKMKSTPEFLTDGKFDIEKFKTIFRGSFKTPDQYAKSLREYMLTSTIEDIFKKSAIISDFQLKMLIEFVAEKKILDIVMMDLNKPFNYYQPLEITEEQIEEFYNKNLAQFTVKEKRKFQYLKLDNSFLQTKLKYSEQDIAEYFEKNKNEFSSEILKEVYKFVEEAYIQEKTSELFSELGKSLEEDIYSGMNIEEIAAKYDLAIYNPKYLSYDQFYHNSNSDHEELADLVFDMEKDETSYPFAVEDKFELYIVKLLDIAPQYEEKIDNVREEIKKQILAQDIIEANLSYMKTTSQSYPQRSPLEYDDVEKNLSIVSNFSLSRFDLMNDVDKVSHLPEGLVEDVLSTKRGRSTDIYIKDNKIYFAYIKKIKSGSDIAKQIITNSSAEYQDAIREGIYLELMQYLTEENEMKINLKYQ